MLLRSYPWPRLVSRGELQRRARVANHVIEALLVKHHL